MSARFGGKFPPATDRAVGPDGWGFGWQDATDLVPTLHASPVNDQALVALVGTDLSPAVAVILADAGQDWVACNKMLLTLYKESFPAASATGKDSGLAVRAADGRERAFRQAIHAAEEAARLAAHRRTPYMRLLHGDSTDLWFAESTLRWATRALQWPLLLDTDLITSSLDKERIRGTYKAALKMKDARERGLEILEAPEDLA